MEIVLGVRSSLQQLSLQLSLSQLHIDHLVQAGYDRDAQHNQTALAGFSELAQDNRFLRAYGHPGHLQRHKGKKI